MLTVYDLMEINKPKFTGSDNTICNALNEYPGLIERYTVSQLADYLGISTASIMRFAKKLGYSGYSELRFEYMKSVHGAHDNEHEEASELKNYLRLLIESFERMANIDESQFISLAKDISKHKNVYAIGLGKSGLAAEYMRYSFIRAGKYIETATESVLVNDIPKISAPQDMYIIYSEKASSVSNVLKSFIKGTKDNSKAKICIVTCNPKSSFENQVDRIIVLPKVDIKNEGIRSHSMMLAFVDILLAYYIKEIGIQS